MMTVPPAGTGLESSGLDPADLDPVAGCEPGPVGLSLAATSSRATVSERTPMAAPRVAAATAVGATATTLWCPAASATRASMAVFPDPAGPTTTAPVVGEATSWRAASVWSAPSPSVSSRAARASAAAVSSAGEDSQAAVVTSAASSPGEYQRSWWSIRRRWSSDRSAPPRRSTSPTPAPADGVGSGQGSAGGDGGQHGLVDVGVQ